MPGVGDVVGDHDAVPVVGPRVGDFDGAVGDSVGDADGIVGDFEGVLVGGGVVGALDGLLVGLVVG